MSTCRLGALETGPPKPKPVKVPKPKEDKNKQTSSKQPENVSHFFFVKKLGDASHVPMQFFRLQTDCKMSRKKQVKKLGKFITFSQLCVTTATAKVNFM